MRIKAFILTVCFILSVVIPVAAQTTYPTVTACWSLDETGGPRVDSSGNDYHLTDNNTVGYIGGVVDNAAAFTRANSEWLSLSSDITIADDTAWSISGWYYLDSIGSYPAFYSRSTTGTRLFFTSTNLKLYNDAGAQAQWSLVPATGSWYHFVIVADGTDSSNIQLYLNNSAQGLQTLADSSQTISDIGRINVPTAYYHDGKLDELAIFADALTVDQVDALYNSGGGVGCDTITGAATTGTATTHTVSLPSGDTGTLSMTISAGEMISSLGIALLVLLFSYDLLSSVAKGSKPK